MKHKLLILTRNPVAKVGIASYLSSLFGHYLTIVSTRIADLTPEDMEDAGCGGSSLCGTAPEQPGHLQNFR